MTIEKAQTGIIGFDELTGGGIPRGRVTLLAGGAGTGKTVMALQSLVHAARELGEPGVFVAFEEHSGRIRINASGFDWDLDALSEGQLTFLDFQPSVDLVQSGDFDLTGMLAGMGAAVSRMGARRIVLDATDIILSLLPDRRSMRREIFRLHEWLLEHELTAIITAKQLPSGEAAPEGDMDFMQFMVDSAVQLRHDLVQGISQRSLRVVKYRGSAFDDNDIPYVIGSSGLKLASGFGRQTAPLPVSGERLSTGIERLDSMLEGGYHRGASVLVTGSPGTAKTTLAGAFMEVACEHNECCLLVSFDSRVEEIVRNLASVGIDLKTPLDRGLLRMESAGGLSGSSEIQLMRIRQWAEEHRAGCIAIDPASALSKSGNELLAHSVVHRLVDWCKWNGITLLTTSLLDRAHDADTHTPLHISTIADTWIHLDYRVNGGERNRGLSIIKSRGTAHSNQVRELVLSREGITLADVYTAGGEVLMGTLRMERERAEDLSRRKAEQQHRQYLAELGAEVQELEQRMQTLQASVRNKQKQLAEARGDRESMEDLIRDTDSLIRTRRQSDRDGD
ncbi:MAG: circadian clock protein KaiC [Pseudohongiellaceae bacterium]